MSGPAADKAGRRPARLRAWPAASLISGVPRLDVLIATKGFGFRIGGHGLAPSHQLARPTHLPRPAAGSLLTPKRAKLCEPFESGFVARRLFRRPCAQAYLAGGRVYERRSPMEATSPIRAGLLRQSPGHSDTLVQQPAELVHGLLLGHKFVGYRLCQQLGRQQALIHDEVMVGLYVELLAQKQFSLGA